MPKDSWSTKYGWTTRQTLLSEGVVKKSGTAPKVGETVVFPDENSGWRGVWKVVDMKPAANYPGEHWVVLDPVEIWQTKSN